MCFLQFHPVMEQKEYRDSVHVLRRTELPTDRIRNYRHKTVLDFDGWSLLSTLSICITNYCTIFTTNLTKNRLEFEIIKQ